MKKVNSTSHAVEDQHAAKDGEQASGVEPRSPQGLTAAPVLTAEQHSFPRCPGETPRAYGAFMSYFQLGHARSLQAVADKLEESLLTVKRWSSSHNWADRIQAFNANLLQQQAADFTETHRNNAASWAERLNRFREQEWDVSQKLLSAAQCFLESFGDQDLQKMTLGEVSRALSISSIVGRTAIADAALPASVEPTVSPVQQQMLDALKRLSKPSPAQEGLVLASDPSSQRAPNDTETCTPSVALSGCVNPSRS